MATTVGAAPAGGDGGGRRRWSSSRLSEGQFALVLTIPVIVALLLVILAPTAYSFWMSLHRIDFIFNKTEYIGFANYRRAFKAPEVRHALQITLYYTGLTTFLSVALSVGGALLLNEQFRGRRILMTVAILPWAVSTYATAVIWRYLYSIDWGPVNAILIRLGLIDKPFNFLSASWAVPSSAIAHAWQITPLGLYFILASMQVIPEDLYKMARVDRLGAFGRFRHVMLPYLKAPILIVAVLVTAEAARIFDLILFLTGGGPGDSSTTLTYEIYRNTFQARRYDYGAALGWILVAVVFVITTVYFLLLTVRRRPKAAIDGAAADS